MHSIYLNSVGLVLDIVAGIMLWKFGLPKNINRKGESFLLLERTDEEEIKKARKYDQLAKLAITLLIIGFSLQLLSNHIKPI